MPGSELDPDALIARLWAAEGECRLAEGELRALCSAAQQLVMEQPVLLALEGPLHVAGDIHGQIEDLKRLFELCGDPARTRYLFLGDYVDRGLNSLETVSLLFAYKLKFPNSFFVLRGNHECAAINRIYGFYDECQRRFSLRVWKAFVAVFNCLPVAAVVGGRILCMHGGLSPALGAVEEIARVLRPTDVPDAGVLCDLLWADPEKGLQGWAPNERGVSFVFGANVLAAFLARNDLDLVCRAHQVVEEGYEFFAKRALVTIFSAPNYCGEFDNDGAAMHVTADLVCSFKTLPHRRGRMVAGHK